MGSSLAPAQSLSKIDSVVLCNHAEMQKDRQTNVTENLTTRRSLPASCVWHLSELGVTDDPKKKKDGHYENNWGSIVMMAYKLYAVGIKIHLY